MGTKDPRAFQGFSYSHRKEYVEWVTEAKTEETRMRRLATAIEWMSAGRTHNWRYEPKGSARQRGTSTPRGRERR